jgi:hypothetical protein
MDDGSAIMFHVSVIVFHVIVIVFHVSVFVFHGTKQAKKTRRLFTVA